MAKRRLKKSRTKKRATTKRSPFLLQLSIALSVTLLLFLGVGYYFFLIPKMEGYGMLPWINDQELVVINRRKPVKRFSVIYFKLPNSQERSLRRVIGLPGDQLTYRDDELYINGELIVERNLAQGKQGAQQDNTLFTENFDLNQIKGTDGTFIPEQMYLVLGDNRPYASDSRFYGVIAEKNIVGVAQFN